MRHFGRSGHEFDKKAVNAESERHGLAENGREILNGAGAQRFSVVLARRLFGGYASIHLLDPF